MGGLWSSVLIYIAYSLYHYGMAEQDFIVLTGPEYVKEEMYWGSKTLCHICFFELSSTFFFRFTFCAMDSVHLQCPSSSEHAYDAVIAGHSPLERVV